MFQANIAAGISGFCALLWTVAILVPQGWHVSDLFYTIRFDSGLYMVRVSKTGLGSVIAGIAKAVDKKTPDYFQPIIDLMDDHHRIGIMEVTQKLCVVPNEYCDSWKRLQYGSYITLFSGIIILISHGLAAMATMYLVHSLPTEIGRQTSRICIMIPPFLGFTTLVLYFALTYSFGPSDNALNTAYAFWIATFAFILSLVPLLLFESFVNEKAKARIKERKHHKDNFAGYGTAQEQQPQGYGGYPAPQYGYGAPHSYPPQGYAYGGPPQTYSPYPPGPHGPPGPPRY